VFSQMFNVCLFPFGLAPLLNFFLGCFYNVNRNSDFNTRSYDF
jgi:hypothetical protein